MNPIQYDLVLTRRDELLRQAAERRRAPVRPPRSRLVWLRRASRRHAAVAGA